MLRHSLVVHQRQATIHDPTSQHEHMEGKFVTYIYIIYTLGNSKSRNTYQLGYENVVPKKLLLSSQLSLRSSPLRFTIHVSKSSRALSMLVLSGHMIRRHEC